MHHVTQWNKSWKKGSGESVGTQSGGKLCYIRPPLASFLGLLAKPEPAT